MCTCCCHIGTWFECNNSTSDWLWSTPQNVQSCNIKRLEHKLSATDGRHRVCTNVMILRVCKKCTIQHQMHKSFFVVSILIKTSSSIMGGVTRLEWSSLHQSMGWIQTLKITLNTLRIDVWGKNHFDPNLLVQCIGIIWYPYMHLQMRMNGGRWGFLRMVSWRTNSSLPRMKNIIGGDFNVCLNPTNDLPNCSDLSDYIKTHKKRAWERSHRTLRAQQCTRLMGSIEIKLFSE